MKRIAFLCAGLMAALWLAGCHATASRAARPASAGPKAALLPGAFPIAAQRDSRDFQQRAEADARFMAGLCHELNEETDLALDDFSKAVLADPANEAVALDLTTRFILLKRYQQAEELLRKCLERKDASAQIDTRLAFVLLQMGRTNDAIQVNQAAIHKDPKFIGGYRNLYHLFTQARQTNEAARILEEAAAVQHPGAEFLVDLSEMYFLQNRAAASTNGIYRTRAHEALKKALDLNPTNFFVLQKMADGFTQLRDTKRAATTLARIQLLHPDLPNIRERLLDLYLRDRDKKGATEQLEGVIRENPTNPQAYYLLGILAFDDQRFKDAADSFHKAILLNPDFEPAYYELAVCHINLKQAKEALAVLAQAREKFKETFLSEYFSALAYLRQNDYTNAAQRFTSAEVIASATDTNRLTHVFYFQFGSACERAGRWSESEKLLLKCLKMAPDFVEALNYLGYMWAERGTNLTQARDMIERALKKEPDSAAYLDSLGWVLFKQGQPRDALKYIQRAISLEKEPDATLYDHLGDIWAELKEPVKAREAWRKALSIEQKPEIQKKLLRP